MSSLPSRWMIPTANPDTADDPDVFPFLAGQGFKMLKTPVWSTKTDISVSGVERRRQLWSYPLWRFRLGYQVMRDGSSYLELQRLFNFFNSHAGVDGGFFYLDRDDNAVVTNQFGTGDGTTKTFQVTRTTTIGSVTFTEPIRGFAGNPTIFDNGSSTSAFTIGTLGQITFTTAPVSGHVLTWTGSFFFLCRFDSDELDSTSQLASGLWANNQVEFRTFKA